MKIQKKNIFFFWGGGGGGGERRSKVFVRIQKSQGGMGTEN